MCKLVFEQEGGDRQEAPAEWKSICEFYFLWEVGKLCGMIVTISLECHIWSEGLRFHLEVIT